MECACDSVRHVAEVMRLFDTAPADRLLKIVVANQECRPQTIALVVHRPAARSGRKIVAFRSREKYAAFA